MTTRWIQYRVRAEAAEENAAQIRAVMAELATSAPQGISYAAFVLPDGVTFVHVVSTEDDGAALRGSAAFQRFVGSVESRCVESPVTRELTPVGSYRPEPTR